MHTLQSDRWAVARPERPRCSDPSAHSAELSPGPKYPSGRDFSQEFHGIGFEVQGSVGGCAARQINKDLHAWQAGAVEKVAFCLKPSWLVPVV